MTELGFTIAVPTIATIAAVMYGLWIGQETMKPPPERNPVARGIIATLEAIKRVVTAGFRMIRVSR